MGEVSQKAQDQSDGVWTQVHRQKVEKWDLTFPNQFKCTNITIFFKPTCLNHRFEKEFSKNLKKLVKKTITLSA